MDTKSKLIAGLSEILETAVTEETTFDETIKWDSVAVVMTVALLDDVAGVQADGEQLSECESVRDVLAIAGV